MPEQKIPLALLLVSLFVLFTMSDITISDLIVEFAKSIVIGSTMVLLINYFKSHS